MTLKPATIDKPGTASNARSVSDVDASFGRSEQEGSARIFARLLACGDFSADFQSPIKRGPVLQGPILDHGPGCLLWRRYRGVDAWSFQGERNWLAPRLIYDRHPLVSRSVSLLTTISRVGKARGGISKILTRPRVRPMGASPLLNRDNF